MIAMTKGITMNIDRMNVEELQDLQKQVANAIVAKQREARSQIKKQIRDLAEHNGTTVEALFGLKAGRKAKGSVAAKYGNPANPAETWSGRGRMPRWLQQKIQGGAQKADFLIS